MTTASRIRSTLRASVRNALTLPADAARARPPSSARLTATGKVLVVALTCWALLVVMPDALRIVRPLGSLGFSADNDGRVYSVDAGGPAAAAGVKVGDRLALDKMSCSVDLAACTQLLAVFGGLGGVQYVRPDSSVSLWLRAKATASRDAPPKRVTITAVPETHGATPTEQTLWKIVLGADELGALAFILGGAALFWRRPCTMTGGFFLFALWFNPGQYFEFYSWLQGYPVAILVQETLQAIFQSLGYVGFVALALYFPNDLARPRLRWVRRSLPWLFVLLASLQLGSFLNVFGFGTEQLTRAAYVAGWALDLTVLLFLLPLVLQDQPPEEKARTRWLLTGCTVGLGCFIFADFSEATTMSPWDLPETVINLLYFLNVTTLAAVIYTVRHHRVVNVSFALTRGIERLGLWALVTGLGAYLIHRVDVQLGHESHWDEVAVSLALIGTTLAWERIAERAIDLLDFVFFPKFRKAIADLRHLARQLCDFESLARVDRSLVERPVEALHISSAAVFRRHPSGFFRRRCAISWGPGTIRDIDAATHFVAARLADADEPVRLRHAHWTTGRLPDGVALPTLAVPIRAFGRLHAIVLYGAHHRGDDLNDEELETLARLAQSAALAYHNVEAQALRRQVRALARLGEKSKPAASAT